MLTPEFGQGYDRWARKEQREQFGKRVCGRLISMCSASDQAVGKRLRLKAKEGKVKLARKGRSRDGQGLRLWIELACLVFPILFRVVRKCLGLMFCPGYKYKPSTIVIRVHNQINTTGYVPPFESFSRVVEFFERANRSVDLRKSRQPCYHV